MDKYFIQDNLGFIIFIGAIFQLVILYLIINAATKANLRARYEWTQLELIAKMARVQGVPQDEIESTFKAAGLPRVAALPGGIAKD
jgi:hypothetical protein